MRLPAQHVVGDSAEDTHLTWLLRRRYYQLLHETVVELFASAKGSAEKLYGHELEARAHATWAQSPTIDFWRAGNLPHTPRQYEYTPDFLWSNTIHQAASACSDYFAWNDFLTGGGNDHAEGGWSDRNYYALALACSTGVLNRVPYAYAAGLGHACSRRTPAPGVVRRLRCQESEMPSARSSSSRARVTRTGFAPSLPAGYRMCFLRLFGCNTGIQAELAEIRDLFSGCGVYSLLRIIGRSHYSCSAPLLVAIDKETAVKISSHRRCDHLLLYALDCECIQTKLICSK